MLQHAPDYSEGKIDIEPGYIGTSLTNMLVAEQIPGTPLFNLTETISKSAADGCEALSKIVHERTRQPEPVGAVSHGFKFLADVFAERSESGESVL